MSEIKIVLDAFTQEKSLDGSIVKLQKIVDLTERLKANKGAVNGAGGFAETSKLVVETEKLATAKEKEVKATQKATKESIKSRVEQQIKNAETKRQARLESDLIGAYEKQSIRLNSLRKSYKDLAVQNRENSFEAKKLLKEIKALDTSLKEVDATVGQHQRNVGNYKDALSALSPTFSNAANAANTFGGALLKLVKNPFILLLTTIGGALTSFFTQSEKGIEKLERGTAGLSAGFSVIIDRFAIFGDAISELFSGNFSEAARLAKESFKDIGSEIAKETEEAILLRKALQEVEDAQRALRVEESKQRLEIDRLILTAKDRSLSEEQRLKNLKLAGEIERKLTKEKLRLAEEELRVEQAKFDASSKTDADADALAEKEIARNEILGESNLKLQEIKNRESKLLEDLQQEKRKQNEIIYQLSVEELEREQNAAREARTQELEEQEAFFKSVEDLRKKQEEERKKRNKEIFEEGQKVLNQTFNKLQENSDLRTELINKEISEEERKIERQQELADKGLGNTLAFEEKKKAELERAAIDEQKRKEKIKKIEAFFNLFSEYAKEDPKTALPNSIRDIALATAFSQAFAEEGGIVGELAKNIEGGRIVKGIFKGRSHKQGGIHLEAEGEEGILSKKEMRNLGRDNFYSLKDLAKQPIDSSLFERQNEAFIKTIPLVVKQDNKLIEKIDELKIVIENQPHTEYKGLVKDMFIFQSSKNGNKVKTYYKPKRFG